MSSSPREWEMDWMNTGRYHRLSPRKRKNTDGFRSVVNLSKIQCVTFYNIKIVKIENISIY